jgi:O-antigen/teichoic acid export membrane protein
LNKQILGRGAAYIYIQFFVLSIAGYIFWIFLSQMTNSVLIGTLSTIVATSEILTSIAVIGIPDSIQRFLGKTFSEQKAAESKVFIIVSLCFIFLGVFGSSLIIILNNSVSEIKQFDFSLKLVIILVVASSSINNLLNSIVIASLKTKILATSVIIPSIVKIMLSIIVVMLGGNIVGLAICYLVIGNIISSILLGNVTIKHFRSIPKAKDKPESRISVIRASKEILIGGVASWIPLMVTTIGYQLGTIIIFGSQGAVNASFYFISLTIVNGIILFTTAIFTIALPALSSIEDGRKRFAWETIRWSSLISIPLSSSIFFYSKEILQLFGQSYTQAELSLQILLLSIFPTVIANGIDTLVYSYGNYRKSLAINLGMNITRTLMYFILIPLYGSTGAAIGFTFGSLLGLVVSATIAKKIKMLIFWKVLILIVIIPMAIGFFIYNLHVNFVIGFPITIILSYLALLKLGTITKSDIHDVIDIFPPGISSGMLRLLRKLKRN